MLKRLKKLAAFHAKTTTKISEKWSGMKAAKLFSQLLLLLSNTSFCNTFVVAEQQQTLTE